MTASDVAAALVKAERTLVQTRKDTLKPIRIVAIIL